MVCKRYLLWDFFEFYNEALDSDPILTKALTSATVYTIGDIIAQRSEGASKLDNMRIMRSLLAGFIGHGPLSHYWYEICEDVFIFLDWNEEWWVALPKVILDQISWAPFWNNVYIILLGVMRCQHWKTIWSDIRRTTIPLIVSGLKLWPAAHVITVSQPFLCSFPYILWLTSFDLQYGYVSVEYRLLWVDLVEILWVTILATQAAGKQKHRRKKKLVAEQAGSKGEGGENDEESNLHGNSLPIEMPEAKVN